MAHLFLNFQLVSFQPEIRILCDTFLIVNLTMRSDCPDSDEPFSIKSELNQLYAFKVSIAI